MTISQIHPLVGDTRPKCSDNPNLFTDPANAYQAKTATEMCQGCPYLMDCRERGARTKGTGVWGGVFMRRGAPRQFRKTKSTHN